MTAGQRVRLEALANGAPGFPTVEDIRILLEAVTRLEYVLDATTRLTARDAAETLVRVRGPYARRVKGIV